MATVTPSTVAAVATVGVPNVAPDVVAAVATVGAPLIQAGIFPAVVAGVATVGAVELDVSGPAAGVTAQAESGATATVGTDVVVYGSTAGSTAAVPSGATVTLSGGGMSVAGVTATGYIAIPNGGSAYLGTLQPGDSWRAPTSITGLSGSVSWSSTGYTTESDEPTSLTTFYRSRWFSFSNGSGDVVFTATGSTSVLVEVFNVGYDTSVTTSWTVAESATGTSAVTAPIFTTSNSPMYVRVATTADTVYTMGLSWTVTPLVSGDSPTGTGSLLQVLQKEIDVTPNSVLFSMMDLDDEEVVSFSISPDPQGWGTITTLQADETGIITGGSVPLPDDLSPGTFQLIGSYSLGTASDSFQVLYAPFTTPAAETADSAPNTTAATRWVLQDRYASGLAEFEFTYNPDRMTSPWAPRTYVSESTTAPDGQAVVWEGIERTVDWEFAGYIDAEADHDALLAYAGLNRRFYVIDHRQRAWICTFSSVDLQPKRVINKPYAFNYVVKALIYGGPVV